MVVLRNMDEDGTQDTRDRMYVVVCAHYPTVCLAGTIEELLSKQHMYSLCERDKQLGRVRARSHPFR